MKPRFDEEIHHHGNMELLVRDEAERWGWAARLEDVGVDPEAATAAGRVAPERGEVVLERDGDSQSFVYELPEDGSEIRETIRRLVRADELERSRRRAGVVGSGDVIDFGVRR